MGFQQSFKALSDPVRREILSLLRRGPMAAGDIAALRPRLAPCRRKARLVFRIPWTVEQMRCHEDDLMIRIVHETNSDAGDSHVDTENQFARL